MAISKIPTGVLAVVKEKCAIVVNATGVVSHVWGGSTTPDHNNKRCIDFMIKNKAQGDKVAAYLKANAKNLGVTGMIWNHRVMGFPSNGTSYRGPEGQWRSYSGPSPHTDHVHCEFNANPVKGGLKPAPAKPPAKKPTPSKWNGKSFPGASAFQLNKSHPAVTVLGKRLVAHGFGKRYKVGPGPKFTNVDRLATQDFQLAQGYKGTQKGGGADGYPGPQTWAALMKAPKKKAPAKKAPAKKSINAMAKEVIAGKWGNNPQRAQKLKAAGYDAKKIQTEVNRLLR